MYDLVVNGGVPLTLDFTRHSYFGVQRVVNVGWQRTTRLDSIVMLQADGRVTEVDLRGGQGIQVAMGDRLGPRWFASSDDNLPGRCYCGEAFCKR